MLKQMVNLEPKWCDHEITVDIYGKGFIVHLLHDSIYATALYAGKLMAGTKKETSVAISLQANYTHRSTAAAGEASANFCR
jgi:hypothetical protein